MEHDTCFQLFKATSSFLISNDYSLKLLYDPRKRNNCFKGLQTDTMFMPLSTPKHLSEIKSKTRKALVHISIFSRAS